MSYKNIITGMSYLCPECDSDTTEVNGDDIITHQECTECGWAGNINECEEYVEWEERFCPPGN